MDQLGSALLELMASLPPENLFLIAVLTFVTSTIHGATGVAGGVLLAAALAPVIGVKPLVPVISVALLISHSSRAWLNLSHIQPRPLLLVSASSVPFVIIAAVIYGKMTSGLIAIVLGLVLISSIPIRRWSNRRKLKTSPAVLSLAGSAYGFLSGMSVGPGALLAPFLLGYGLNRQAFVATLAVIALITNISRVGVYGTADLLHPTNLMLGILVGVLTIPGNWFGRSVLQKMTNTRHIHLIEFLSVMGALNFFWLAWRQIG